MHKRWKDLYVEGNALIMKAGLSSLKQIEAANLWKSVVFLRSRLEKSSLRIEDLDVEDVIRWFE